MNLQNPEHIFAMLYPYIDPDSSPEQDEFSNISDYFMDRILNRDYSSFHNFLKNDLTEEEKAKFYTLIKIFHLDSLISREFTEDQKISLIRYDLIEIPDDITRFDLSSISAKLRINYISEHFNARGHFDSKLTRLYSDIRNVFNLYGDEVRFCDILSEKEITHLLNCSKHNHVWTAMHDLAESLDDMFYYTIQIPPGEFIIVRDDEEIRYESKKKPYSVKSAELTPKGYAVSCALNLLFNNDYRESPLKTPIRTFDPFHEAYYQPYSEERIIRDYYDEIYGFRRFWDYMENKDDLIKIQKLWPRFLGIQPNPQYSLFKQELIRLNILDQEQISRLEAYFIKHVADMIGSLLPSRESYPFLICKMLEEDHPEHYNRIENQVRDDLNRFFKSPDKDSASKIKTLIVDRMLYACMFYNIIFGGGSYAFPSNSQKISSNKIKDKIIAFMTREFFDSDPDKTIKIKNDYRGPELDADILRDSNVREAKTDKSETDSIEPDNADILFPEGIPTTTASKIIALFLSLLFGDGNSSEQVRKRYELL
jgi:hypothetical protein